MLDDDSDLASIELLVIGLGPSGIAALNAARSAGARAGGIELRPAPLGDKIPEGAYETRVWGMFTDGSVACTSSIGTRGLSPRAVIVATGAIDIPLPVPGWHLRGAVGACDGAGSLSEGASVVVLRGPHAASGPCTPDLSRFTVLHNETLSDGNPVKIVGNGTVSGCRIGNELVETRHVLLDNGLQPENTLARMAGIPTQFSPQAGGDVVAPGKVFAVGGTLISVIGDAAGIGCDPDTMAQEATETARLLTESLAGGDIPRFIPSSRSDWEYEGLPLLPAQATPETLVCPEEGVSIAQVREAIERGATTVNDVKRRTRAAMAPCQGRDCLWTIRALLAEYHCSFRTPMTARPPVTTITLGDLAALTRS